MLNKSAFVRKRILKL